MACRGCLGYGCRCDSQWLWFYYIHFKAWFRKTEILWQVGRCLVLRGK
jgi:hypothetical protein